MNNKGFTIAEGLVAMVVLAVVTVGIFAAVLSSVRATKTPDTREDIAFAIAAATQKIRLAWDSDRAGGARIRVCPEIDTDVEEDADVTINCFLPPSCAEGSSMTYRLDQDRRIVIGIDCKQRL